MRNHQWYLSLDNSSKVRRIETLSGWLRSGAVQFHQEQRLLLEQLRDFPQGRHDDGADSLEMCVRTAEEGGRRYGTVTIVGGDSDNRWRGSIDLMDYPGFF